MGLSREEIAEIARASAQATLEELHRYTVEYREPTSVEQGLQDSIIEELTAADWYQKRAKHADSVGDTITRSLYYDIADEEQDHYKKLSKRLSLLRGEIPREELPHSHPMSLK